MKKYSDPATENIHKLKVVWMMAGRSGTAADNLREKASGTPNLSIKVVVDWLYFFLLFTRNFDAQLEAGADSVHIHRRRKKKKKLTV